MIPNQNGVYTYEIQQEKVMSRSSTRGKLPDHIPIDIPAIERELMDHSHHEERLLDSLKAHPTNSISAFSEDPIYEAPSAPDPIPSGSQRQLSHVSFVRKINWASIVRYFKKWIKHPANIAVFIWFLFVVAVLILYVLVSTGILNGAIPGSNRRKNWTEVINQILNALLMIMCLYHHPYLCRHSVLLCRWRKSDRVEIRKVYCKDGVVRPHERAHIVFVVLLFHATCISQYVTCALYWAYSRHTRPNWAVNLFLVIGIVTPVIAPVHMAKSPLGKQYENMTEINQETQQEITTVAQPAVVPELEWIGGLFDCCDDPTVATCSLFCTFCVFGRNMKRLGFGNMYVHMFVFILLCVAPFFIFGAAALSISNYNDSIAYIVAIIGAVLCVFGLLYGGFWRREMRRKFKLPANPFCCHYPLLTDYMQWLFCWSCSLAQEVRTTNFYDIEEDKFHDKGSEESGRLVLLSLQQEGEAVRLNGLGFDSSCRSYSLPPQFRIVGPLVSAEAGKGFSPIDVSITFERASTYSEFHTMSPPLPPVIELEKSNSPVIVTFISFLLFKIDGSD